MSITAVDVNITAVVITTIICATLAFICWMGRGGKK